MLGHRCQDLLSAKKNEQVSATRCLKQRVTELESRIEQKRRGAQETQRGDTVATATPQANELEALRHENKMLKAAYGLRLAGAWASGILRARMGAALHTMHMKQRKIAQTKDAFQMFNAQLSSLRQQNVVAVKKAVAEADSENDAILEKLEDALAEAELGKKEARALTSSETEKNELAKETRQASGLKQLRFCILRWQRTALFRVWSRLKMGPYVARIPAAALLPTTILLPSGVADEADENSLPPASLRIREVVFEKEGPLGLKLNRRPQDLHCYVDGPKGQALGLGVQHEDTILAINGSKVLGLAPNIIVEILKSARRPLQITLEGLMPKGEAVGVGFEIWRGSTSAPDSTAKIIELRAQDEKGVRAIEMLDRISSHILPGVKSLLNQAYSNAEMDPFVIALMTQLNALVGGAKSKKDKSNEVASTAFAQDMIEAVECKLKLEEAQKEIGSLKHQLKEQAAVIVALQGAVDKRTRTNARAVAAAAATLL